MTHHKKVYRVLVYLAILGAVGTGATYANMSVKSAQQENHQKLQVLM